MFRQNYLLVYCFFLLVACGQEPPLEAVDEPVDDQEAALPPLADDYENAEYKWGFADPNGNLVLAAKYEEVRPFGPEGWALVRQEGLWNFIDSKGRLGSKTGFAMAWAFVNGYARFRAANDSIGFLDERMRVTITPQFADAGDFQDGYAWVRRGAKYGVINTNGELVLPIIYDKVTLGNEGQFVVKKQQLYGILDTSQSPLIPIVYERIKPFQNGLALAKQNGRYGYLNLANEWAIEPQYLQASSFAENRAVVLNEAEEFELINPEGQNFTREGYRQLWYGGTGYWLVADGDDHYGAIDSSGQIILPLMFDELQAPSEGFAVYAMDQGWGYIRLADGTQLTPPVFGLAWPFKHGSARVATQRGMTIIDTTGRIRFQPRYLDLRDGSYDLIPVQVYE